MFNVILCMSLVLSATLLGNCFSERLTNRRKSIASLIEALSRMKAYLSFGEYEVFRLVKESFSGVKVFDAFCVCDETEADFTSWWRNNVLSLDKSTGLTREDKELLLRFGENLGITDTDGQIAHLELYAQLFAENLACAKEAEKTKGKLYRVLGFSAGCALILIIL